MGAAAPLSWGLVVWVSAIAVLQGFNVFLGASWPYLLGVFGLLVNGFTFFLVLLLTENTEEDAPA